MHRPGVACLAASRRSGAARGRDRAARARRAGGAARAMTRLERRCWHCGEALPPDVDIQARVAGEVRAMCCHGCRAAAEWIEHLGLAQYYALRTAPASVQRDPAGPVDSGASAWIDEEDARHVVRDLGAGLRECLLLIEGIHCTACGWLIERALGSMPG